MKKLTLRDKSQIYAKGIQFHTYCPRVIYRHFWKNGDPFIEKFHEKKAIFIHIPKTAGKSVANAIFNSSVGHRPIHRYFSYHPEKAASYFKFTFVRNPWDRLFSAYNYFNAVVGKSDHRDHRWANSYLSNINSFESFVYKLQNPCFLKQIKRYDHFRNQVDWITNPQSGCIEIDYIGRFENLFHDFCQIIKCLDVNLELEHLNKGTSNSSYKYQYNQKMIDIVERSYYEDVTILNYEF